MSEVDSDGEKGSPSSGRPERREDKTDEVTPYRPRDHTSPNDWVDLIDRLTLRATKSEDDLQRHVRLFRETVLPLARVLVGSAMVLMFGVIAVVLIAGVSVKGATGAAVLGTLLTTLIGGWMARAAYRRRSSRHGEPSANDSADEPEY